MRPVGRGDCRLSAKFRTMNGTGLLSEQMMDAFVAKRSADIREATKQTTSQTPPRSSIIKKAAWGGISAAELRKSPATGHNPATEIPTISAPPRKMLSKRYRSWWSWRGLLFWVGVKYSLALNYVLVKHAKQAGLYSSSRMAVVQGILDAQVHHESRSDNCHSTSPHINPIPATQGFRGFYKGYFTTVAPQIPFSFMQFPI